MSITDLTDKPPTVTYKTLLLGESGVGKTSLVSSLMRKEFHENFVSTIGIDFVKKIYQVDGVSVCLEIWDTAGQERFRSITRFHYRGTKGLLLLYDITDQCTFDLLTYWLQSIKNDLDLGNEEPVAIFLVGNKCDLDKQRHVRTEEGRKLAFANSIYGFHETSAKTGLNVDTVFESLAATMLEVYHPKLMRSRKVGYNPNIGAHEIPNGKTCEDNSEKSKSNSTTSSKHSEQRKSIKLTADKHKKKKPCKCSS